jgi:DNA-binding transcriptional MerR regulator
MQPRAARRLRRIKAFADDAGVSVRTLHVYDRLGLLKPAELSESGYRLYGEPELERLEHILAVRFVGFSLDQIKELLQGSNRPLADALRMQREVIARRKRRLELALAAIDEAERALAGNAHADRWQTLHSVIEVFIMQNDWDWTQEYYFEEARRKIEERRLDTPREIVERGERDWAALLAEVEAAASSGVDPSGEPAQALARRWRDLLAQFTQGDADVQRGLNRLWSDSTHWPRNFKRSWSDAADAFIKKAMNRVP